MWRLQIKSTLGLTTGGGDFLGSLEVQRSAMRWGDREEDKPKQAAKPAQQFPFCLSFSLGLSLSLSVTLLPLFPHTDHFMLALSFCFIALSPSCLSFFSFLFAYSSLMLLLPLLLAATAALFHFPLSFLSVSLTLSPSQLTHLKNNLTL